MQSAELRRLIVRHRHVAPMLSVLLASTDARVHITDADGETILDRDSKSADEDAGIERHPIVVEGENVGWVEGPRPSGAVAAVLSYACSRETDKRSLASEAPALEMPGPRREEIPASQRLTRPLSPDPMPGIPLGCSCPRPSPDVH